MHRKLLEGLGQLSEENDDLTCQWQEVSFELQTSYNEAYDLLRKAEQGARAYNQLQALIRTKVSIGLKNKKKRII